MSSVADHGDSNAAVGYACHLCGGKNGSMTWMGDGWQHNEPIFCAWAERDRLANENQGLKNDKTTLQIAARHGAEVGAVVGSIWRIVNEPLDERAGHGPTRHEQFARIESLLRDFFDEELQRERARAAEDAKDGL